MKNIKKKSKIKKLSLKTQQKAKAWKAFSAYIRTRDCLRTTGTPYAGKCITCQKKYIFQSLHAGHFQSGRRNKYLLDEEQVFAQCAQCNIYLHGNQIQYYKVMIKKYGQEKVDAMLESNREIVKYTAGDFQALATYYKVKTKELLK